MFVVPINFIFYGAYSTNNSETLFGKQTGESPEVVSMLRMELVGGDFPLYFNPKLFGMPTTNDNNTAIAKALKAEKIIRELLEHDSPENIMENFHDVMLAFISYNEVIPREEMIEIIFSYRAVRDMLKKIKKLFN